MPPLKRRASLPKSCTLFYKIFTGTIVRLADESAVKQSVVLQDSHYVQDAYLAGFTERHSGLLWVYDRDSHTITKAPPKAVAKIAGYYLSKQSDGSLLDFENAHFLQELERKGVEALRKVRDGIGSSEKKILAQYIALCAVRTPAYESAFSRNMLQELYSLCEGASVPMPRTPPYELRLKRRKQGKPPGDCLELSLGEGSAAMSAGFHARLIVKNVLDQGIILARLGWKLLLAPPSLEFLTTDNPCSVILSSDDPSSSTAYIINVGNHPRARIVFPVSRESCLVISKCHSREDSISKADEALVREVNGHAVRRMHRFAFSPAPLLGLLPTGARWTGVAPRNRVDAT